MANRTRRSRRTQRRKGGNILKKARRTVGKAMSRTRRGLSNTLGYLSGGNPYSMGSLVPGGDSIFPESLQRAERKRAEQRAQQAPAMPLPQAPAMPLPQSPVMPLPQAPAMPLQRAPVMPLPQEKSIAEHMTGHAKDVGFQARNLLNRVTSHPTTQGVLNHPVTRRARNVGQHLGNAFRAAFAGGKSTTTRKGGKRRGGKRRGGKRTGGTRKKH